MNEQGAQCVPRIEVRTQPAQSPDINLNDLALFRALDVAVRKMRRGGGNAFEKEKLVRDAVLASDGGLPFRAVGEDVGVHGVCDGGCGGVWGWERVREAPS